MGAPLLLRTNHHQEILRAKYATRKTSAPKTDLGQSVDGWEQKIRDALIAQHPWASRVKVDVVLSATSAEGYGTGVLLLSSMQVPAAAIGLDRVNVLSVPLVVDNCKLHPLDLFAFKDQFYPLREDRAMRLLRLPDIFQETGRDTQTLERLGRYTQDHNFPSDSFARFGSSLRDGSIKGSQARVMLRKACLSAAKALRPKAPVLERSSVPAMHAELSTQYPYANAWVSNRAKTSKASAPVSVLPSFAHLYGVQVRKSPDSFEVRDWYYSSPQDGNARVGVFEKTSYAQLAPVLTSAQMKTLLAQGDVFIEASRPKTSHTDVRRVCKSLYFEKLHADVLARHGVNEFLHGGSPQPASMEKVSSCAVSLSHGDSSFPNSLAVLSIKDHGDCAPAVLLKIFNERGLLGLPGAFEGWVVNDAQSTWRGRLGLLTTQGTLVCNIDPAGHSAFGSFEALLLPDSHITLDVPPIKDVSVFVGDVEDLTSHSFNRADGVLVWNEKGVLLGLRVCTSGVSIEGAPIFTCAMPSQTGGPSQNLPVVLQPGLARMRVEGADDNRRIYLPQGVRYIPLGLPKLRPEPAEAQAPALENPEARLTLSCPRPGRFRLQGVALEGLDANDCTQAHADRSLAFLGVGSADRKMALSFAEKMPVTFGVERLPALSQGAQLVQQARQKASQVEARAQTFLRTFRPQGLFAAVELMLRCTDASVKLSSPLLGEETVDSVLGLGFLNRSNVMKFVDALPELEACLSRLCSLLLASRLGLKEVPADSVSMAIDALDPVLEGLRVLKMTLEAV